ncbi:MAG TPA: ABC transporter ATP-binding protein [Gaiellales bacterium]|nr:ABC transporter ATP-binding protein [Gaiellales bacterium]
MTVDVRDERLRQQDRRDTGEAVVRARDLIKVYGEGRASVRALDGVDLDVAHGEFSAIMGPSGSGKSTLLHMLGGLDAPTSGSVRIGGVELGGLGDRELTLLRRRRMGFIFQFFNLLPTLTAEENVAFPLLLAGESPHRYQERIDSLLDLVGLVERRHHLPQELSGGEQQRVAVARALVSEPEIVLADEPTGNLDSATGEDVLAIMRRSCGELGQTIVMVTHDPTAAGIADRTLFMRDGMIVHEGRGLEVGAILDEVKRLQARDRP